MTASKGFFDDELLKRVYRDHLLERISGPILSSPAWRAWAKEWLETVPLTPEQEREMVQDTLAKIRWMVSDTDGQMFGAELIFTDGSRVQMRMGNGTADGGSCVALRPQDFSSAQGFTLADA